MVDFSNIIMQKFGAFRIEGNNLILIKNNKEIMCKIKQNVRLVKNTLLTQNKNLMFSNKDSFGLSKLKHLSVIDIVTLVSGYNSNNNN